MHSDCSFPALVRDALFLSGPTASGKSAVGMLLADSLNAELLSLDSIAVYRQMDIGTAKPTPEDRQRVPHHLLDLADPQEEFSISRYLRAAHAAVAEIRQRGRFPIFVGGTPLYLKALLRGFYSGPPADWEFRQAVEQDVQQHGVEALHRRLAQVDPLTAHRLPASDVRRITRALEVAYVTGQPLSHWQHQFERPTADAKAQVFALRVPRPALRARIDQRVEQMFQRGLIEEVAGIEQAAGDPDQAFGRTAGQAVGYRETRQHLRGELTREDTIEQVRIHTRQLAKRQETWFRSLEEVRFIELEATGEDPSRPQKVAETIVRSLGRSANGASRSCD